MKTKQACHVLVVFGLSSFLVAATGSPATAGSCQYGAPPARSYDPYAGRPYTGSWFDVLLGQPFFGGAYDPYYRPERDAYAGSSRSDDHRYHGATRRHGKLHDWLDRKYNKAMRRLDRQEHAARAKAARKYDGDLSNPHYRERLRKIDRKYAHKREKVERNLSKEHRKGHNRIERRYGVDF